MAFLKYADAIIKNASVEPKTWNQIRHASTSIAKVPVDTILPDFSTQNYLLTHCTIVASVDVEENGYYIKPKCNKYVNQNGDAWERALLNATFPTFIGSQNYLEHVQIPILSKGRIVDAVARPVNNNESVYIDILVATERKHRDLIASIESGELSTLSMGCSIKYSICSKCGNKAVDESQLCTCIRYLKGHTFHDENGVERIIAELCGHKDDPESNVFIEASWVKVPAFKGAVLRNIININGNSDDVYTAKKIEAAYVIGKKEPSNHFDLYLKAASSSNLSLIKRKVDAIIQSKEILKRAGVDPHDEDEFGYKPEKNPDQPEEDIVSDEDVQEGEAPVEELSETAHQEQTQEPPEQEEAPVEAEQQTEQQEQPIEEPEQEQSDTQQQEMSPEDMQMMEQAQQQGGDPGMDPQMGGMPQQSQPADSFESLVDKVKKDIRTRVIEELQKEIDEKKINELNDAENTKIHGVSINDNLVKAFVDIYKPKTKFSTAKLASIFKLIVAGEKGLDFRKYAVSNRDLLDFFEFVDTFQVTENSLNKRDYALLRKASVNDFKTVESTVSFLNKSGITNKQVIKRIVAKVRFLKR